MLGVLRCDWAELASLIGVAVTPVVGFLGNLSREQIHPNPDEVRAPNDQNQAYETVLGTTAERRGTDWSGRSCWLMIAVVFWGPPNSGSDLVDTKP